MDKEEARVRGRDGERNPQFFQTLALLSGKEEAAATKEGVAVDVVIVRRKEGERLTGEVNSIQQ